MTARIDVRVIPRAGKSEIAGIRNNALLVRLKAAPVGGAANDELVTVLARALRVHQRAVTIVSGHTSRSKRVAIDGLTDDEARRRLGSQ